MPLSASTSAPSGTAPQRDAAFTKFFTLVACFVGCAIVWLTLPRAVLPETLPVLMLDAQAVAEARARDAQVAQAVLSPADADALKSLHALHLAAGQDELRGDVHYDASQSRALWTLAARLSAEARERARVDSADRALGCLDHEASCPDGLLGSFPKQLERYGLVEASASASEQQARGARRAPVLSVRAAYKMRWNMLHDRPRLEGITRIEEQAFFGFVALHARQIPLVERAQAARSFYEAGGNRGAEAYAVFLFQGGAPQRALELLEYALDQRFELRLRNLARGVALSLREADF